MENSINLLKNIILEAEKLLEEEFNSPTNNDFNRALKWALRGTPLENRVSGGFEYNDGDRYAPYIIRLDGKPVFEAGGCHVAGYPGNRCLGVHSGYYYGVTEIK